MPDIRTFLSEITASRISDIRTFLSEMTHQSAARAVSSHHQNFGYSGPNIGFTRIQDKKVLIPECIKDIRIRMSDLDRIKGY